MKEEEMIDAFLYNKKQNMLFALKCMQQAEDIEEATRMAHDASIVLNDSSMEAILLFLLANDGNSTPLGKSGVRL